MNFLQGVDGAATFSFGPSLRPQHTAYQTHHFHMPYTSFCGTKTSTLWYTPTHWPLILGTQSSKHWSETKVPEKICKVFKILCHIESCGTCINY